jgi:predicted nucleotidyltransferase
MMSVANYLKLQTVLDAQPGLELAILVGSQVKGRTHSRSDWDIAIQWQREMSWFDNLANTEKLRRLLAVALGVEETLVDLINLPNAKLAMRALVADDGVVLKGEDSLAWNHFLGRTWRELEAYEWEKEHAA